MYNNDRREANIREFERVQQQISDAPELKPLLLDDGYAKLFDRLDFDVLGRGEIVRENFRTFESALR